MVIQAASGAGKSSFLRAGLWPKLWRTAEFVPLAIVRPAKGVITGPQGLGKGLEHWFGRHRIRRSAGAINAELTAGDATAGAAKLAGFMSEAAKVVTEARSLAAEDARPPARPSMMIAIDQGEELFAAEDAAESERFIAMLGHLLAHPPDGLDPYALITASTASTRFCSGSLSSASTRRTSVRSRRFRRQPIAMSSRGRPLCMPGVSPASTSTPRWSRP
jgi:hypothetical protein